MSDSSFDDFKHGSSNSGQNSNAELPMCNCLMQRIIVLPRGFAESLWGLLAKKGFLSTGYSFDGEDGNANSKDGYGYFRLPVGWRIYLRKDSIRVCVDVNGQAQICTAYGGLAAWVVNSGDCNRWLYKYKMLTTIDDLSGNARFADFRFTPKGEADRTP